MLSAQKTADSPAALNAAALRRCPGSCCARGGGHTPPALGLSTWPRSWTPAVWAGACTAATASFCTRTPSAGACSPTGPQPIVDLSGALIAARDHPVAVALRTGRAARGVVLGVRQGTPQARWVRVDTAVIERAPGAATSCVATILVDVTMQTEHSREPAATVERRHPVEGPGCRRDLPPGRASQVRRRYPLRGPGARLSAGGAVRPAPDRIGTRRRRPRSHAGVGPDPGQRARARRGPLPSA